MRQGRPRIISGETSGTGHSCVSDAVQTSDRERPKGLMLGPTINKRKTYVSMHGSLSLAWYRQIDDSGDKR